jgi:hypothetical protein
MENHEISEQPFSGKRFETWVSHRRNISAVQVEGTFDVRQFCSTKKEIFLSL